ncbi:5215_t:CDS:2 [Funneliformis geosporum]|uniref:5215_t:CDS:1 n=1 Tax=Funneliformis geosporum TaxID=1117311 RepID=A0A9W4SU22_9GLOM|nr:5215_t:CDS:2 [Funneliformis geosporum]
MMILIKISEKYHGKFALCSKIELKKDSKIINISESVIFIHNNMVISRIICDIAKQSVKNHFGYKMKVIIEAHHKIKRKPKSHIDVEKLVGHSLHAKFLNVSTTSSYSYLDKNLDS